MTFVRICAVLIGLRSLTNFAKPFQGHEAIIVFFGQVLHGAEVIAPAILLGTWMLLTAVAMWRPQAYALPMILAYAAFVLLNLILWTVGNPSELQRVGGLLASSNDPVVQQMYGLMGMVLYSSIAIAMTVGPAWVLWTRRAR